MIDFLFTTGSIRGPYRQPSLISRAWRWFARLFEPIPEDRPVVAVILKDPEAEVEDVIGFDSADEAYDWLETHIERWAGGYIALWEPKG